jgi:hypothetical protein
MHDSWLELLDCVLRPARPHLERCWKERARHLALLERSNDERERAVADCEQRIRDARAAVFATDDGVVPGSMTDLEREWRRLSRIDPEAGLMELWTRVTPPSSRDRKRWRDSPPDAWLDAIVALAADAENVEVAEDAIDTLRAALAVRGTALGSRVRWRPLESDPECTVALLAGTVEAASGCCPAARRDAILGRAQQVAQNVTAAVLDRFPERPGLARSLAQAAFVDTLERLGGAPATASPVAALRALWKTGYVLSAFDASSVTLAFPPLARA